jgi:hypothetical protein
MGDMVKRFSLVKSKRVNNFADRYLKPSNNTQRAQENSINKFLPRCLSSTKSVSHIKMPAKQYKVYQVAGI